MGDDYRNGSDGVQCITDLSTCCSNSQGQHRGDWYFPDGTRLPFPINGLIFESRGDQRVNLFRRSGGNSPVGIYRCFIATVAVLYESGDIYENRVAQRVDLRRRNNANSPVGIYRCNIATEAVHSDGDNSLRDTVYVGLYTSGGNLYLHLTCIVTVFSS